MSTNENTPKPKPPFRKPTGAKEEKKPFIPKAHLTQKPFNKLHDIRDELTPKSARKNEGNK